MVGVNGLGGSRRKRREQQQKEGFKARTHACEETLEASGLSERSQMGDCSWVRNVPDQGAGLGLGGTQGGRWLKGSWMQPMKT
jgi:hypothetical protein